MKLRQLEAEKANLQDYASKLENQLIAEKLNNKNLHSDVKATTNELLGTKQTLEAAKTETEVKTTRLKMEAGQEASRLECEIDRLKVLFRGMCICNGWGGVAWGGPLLYATLRYSTLLYATLRYSTLLYATLRYSTLRYSTLLYATLRYSTLLYATLRYSMLLYATLLYATLRYFTLLYATLRYSTLLYAGVSLLF
jgi:uncharacterized protein YjbI with pentapeptide repeats